MWVVIKEDVRSNCGKWDKERRGMSLPSWMGSHSWIGPYGTPFTFFYYFLSTKMWKKIDNLVFLGKKEWRRLLNVVNIQVWVSSTLVRNKLNEENIRDMTHTPNAFRFWVKMWSLCLKNCDCLAYWHMSPCI